MTQFSIFLKKSTKNFILITKIQSFIKLKINQGQLFLKLFQSDVILKKEH